MKTLFIDIETYPEEITAWMNNRQEVIVVDIVKIWRLASAAYIMVEDDRIIQRHCLAVDGKRGNEKTLVRTIRDLFDWADLIVAHNAKFDIGKMRAKYVEYHLDPPSKYRGFCTYNATRTMGFPSKKLDDLCNVLDLGRKVPTLGTHTWVGACQGNPDALALLAEYNLNDADLLFALYKRIRPHVDRDHKPVISGIVPDAAPTDAIAAAAERGRLAGERFRLRAPQRR